jgi:hypothetical protein
MNAKKPVGCTRTGLSLSIIPARSAVVLELPACPVAAVVALPAPASALPLIVALAGIGFGSSDGAEYAERDTCPDCNALAYA